MFERFIEKIGHLGRLALSLAKPWTERNSDEVAAFLKHRIDEHEVTGADGLAFVVAGQADIGATGQAALTSGE